MMTPIRIQTAWLAGLAVALVAAVGCESGPLADMADANPFIYDSYEDEKPYGPSIPEQQAQLESLAAGASSMPPQQQEAVSRKLADELRNEPTDLLRAATARTLGRFRTRSALEGLKLAAADNKPNVRLAAVEALGEHRTNAARDVLAERLGGDTDIDVRIAAARSLGNFQNDPQALKSLTLALDDIDPALQYRAMRSMEAISGAQYGNDVAAWKEFARGGEPTPRPQPVAIIPDWLRWY